ncbi:L-threonylcarbamoyladenylate synthase [Blattabacterium cuenoti]|uniref:L-threonylcarbamoyladenylate synthase n=1 Tax=Blattabacterium cuenoti TaxID=1653831 RepID=UPI00293B9220|nr:L-threonylcarbamoyladenylate synthase [Blattabacterium cuenoti]
MSMSFINEIEQSVKILNQGKSLLYPTDTVWGLGCDPFNIQAVKKIYKIKNRKLFKPMIILVENINRLHDLITFIPNKLMKLLEQNINKPMTIIYDNPRKIISNCIFIKHDKTLAIRITMDTFCYNLIKNLDKPLISTSANLSGDPTPKSFSEIHPSILNKIDYAVNFRRQEKSMYNESSIIKLVSNQITILR